MTPPGRLASSVHKAIDKKGRVSVPPKMRAAFSDGEPQGLYVRPHLTEAAIEAGGQKWLDATMTWIDRHDPASPDYEDLTYAYLADADFLAYDTEGRITLPEALKAKAGITAEVVFVGLNDHIAILSPEAFRSRMAKARDRAIQLRMRLLKREGEA